MSTIKTTNITHGSNTGTSNLVLDSSGNATVNGNLTVTGTGPGKFQSYALLQHKLTVAYSIPNNDSNTRPFNTELDPDNIVTLDTSTGRFSLGAGSYMLRWNEVFYDTQDAIDGIRRWDGSTNIDADYPDTFDRGIVQYSSSTNTSSVVCCGVTRVTVPTGQTYTYALRHHVDDSANTNSGGNNPGLQIGGENHYPYATMEIYKEV